MNVRDPRSGCFGAAPLSARQSQARRALLGRRQPLIVLRPAEQHRLAGTSERLTKDIAEPITWLHERLATLSEASEQLRESYGNGRNLYYRGLKKLREFLGRPLPGREAKDVRS